MRARSIACALLTLTTTLSGCGGVSSNQDPGAAGNHHDAAGSAGSGAGSGSGGTSGCNAEVRFASPVVEAAIRQRLVQPQAPLNGSALKGITELLIPTSAGDVTDLDGMQCLVNLRVLGIPPGSLANLAPLANLGELRSVSFPDNQVTSLAPLSNKPNLRTISASANAVTNLNELTLTAHQCGTLELTANPLTEAAEDALETFCAEGWFVSWGQASTPLSCNDECLPRP
jgi:hypothetical protein